MTRYLYLLSTLLCLSVCSAIAQPAFLNGDFELNAAGPCDYNNSNANFTAKMQNSVAYGAAQELDIMGTGCPYGVPQSGNWFVGLAGWTDAFTMRLNQALVAGQSYTISFWDEGTSQYPPAPPAVIGLSTVPGAVGTNIYTGPTPSFGIWNQRTFTFIAPNNGQYISVSVNAWRWLHVDNFQFVNNVCVPPTLQMDSTGVNCNGGCDGTATVHATGGQPPYTYQWDANANNQTDSTATNLCPGTYQVIVASAGGCSDTMTVTIVEPPVLSVTATHVDPNCGVSGSATANPVGGTGPYSYSWTSGHNTQTAAPLLGGTYTCTVTDAHGCTDTVNVSILIPPGALTLTTTQVDVLCHGNATGTATVNASGGNPPYTYTWSNGQNTATATGLAAGTYSCTVTDINNCAVAISVTITEPAAALTAGSSQVNPTCAVTGSATATPAGGTVPYTYLWSDGQTTQTATGLAAGNYTCTVTDSNGCTTTVNITLPAPPNAMTITSAQVDVLCNGGTTGTATANPSAGTPPYAYLWSDGQTTQTATGLAAGTYTCTVTDAATCTITVSVTILEPTPLVFTPQGNISICAGQNTVLPATVNGGTPPYNYAWAPAGPNVSPLVTTVYTCTVTDANNCTATQNVTVTVNPPLSLQVSQDDSTCLGGTVTIFAQASGGNGGPYSYSWTWAPNGTSGFPSINVNPTVTTTYYVTVTDNCTAQSVSDSVIVTINPLPNIVINADKTDGCKPLCVNFTDGSTIPSGSIVSWNWDFGDGSAISTQQNPSHCYDTEGSYSVKLTATSNLGCVSTFTNPNMIVVHPDPVAEFTFTPTSTTILEPLINFINQSTGAVSYVWDFGDKNDSVDVSTMHPNHTYKDTGMYCVKLTAKSADGCQNEITHCLLVNPQYTLYIPSAFTPNGDFVNDVFLPKGLFILTFEMTIFDRWGEPIFNSKDLNKGWDGTVKGGSTLCQQDVYVYKIKISYNNPENSGIMNKQFTGTVTLVR